MKILTWNVQWCRGIDGRVDPARIVAEARRIADFDVLCLQEVADNFPDPRLAGNDARDQFAAIAGLLPGFEPVPGVAVDHPGEAGRRRRFGNMILSCRCGRCSGGCCRTRCSRTRRGWRASRSRR